MENILVKCKMCDNPVKWNNQRKQWRIYCSRECAKLDKQNQINKRNITNLERYGTINPLGNKDINQKRKETMLDKYGVEFSGQSDELSEKRRLTLYERYGVNHNWERGILREEQQQTMFEKYGVKYPIQNKDIREKIRQTTLERYGVEHATQNGDIQNKRCRTNLKKYGTTYPHQQHMVDILPLITDYNWLFEQYIVHGKTATQIANEIGSNQETICNYLHYHEIEIRQLFTWSYKCICWLEQIMEHEQIYIQHMLNEGEYIIPGTRYKVDGFCKEINTIYEFYGDCWHGNPRIYSPDFYNKTIHKTADEIYKKTRERENVIRSLGYNLIIMWGQDFQQVT